MGDMERSTIDYRLSVETGNICVVTERRTLDGKQGGECEGEHDANLPAFRLRRNLICWRSAALLLSLRNQHK